MASAYSGYHNNSRQLNEGQRAIVGLSAEVIARDWLVAQYKDAEVLWGSGCRDKALGGTEGNDPLGYDIEVVTASNTYYFDVKGAAGDGTEFELTSARDRRRPSQHQSR